MEEKTIKEKIFILKEEEDFTFTQLTEHLNKKFKFKQTGKIFTTQDVQQYIGLERLPYYLGNFIIKKRVFKGVKFYNLIDKDKLITNK